MGVPKLFRFLSERYPCLSQLLKEYEIPYYDNFYIDANGIIHNCSHPVDDIHFRISEEQIFRDIFYYLEVLFRLIQPTKLFFIAIDGVAPRAKMNQQRSRRFRTAKDTESAINEAIKKGEPLPDAERFDSNCITPGTEFMEKLHRQLQYFIKSKISTDTLWQRPKIILSGHNVPGEGEHKIMDYIRFLRSQSDWDPNTRHVLHGLDADLIMLGLCTHEPHFSLLREEVKFSKVHSKKAITVEQTKFYLLHLSLMRSYLDLEFQQLKTTLPFKYDIEQIIDDWVLMCFLVGNDFIPHLPNFHIANNALSTLYNTYIEVLPTLDGYINCCGILNLDRFAVYLKKLAEIDFDNFRDYVGDLKYLESKTGRKAFGTLDEDLDDEVLTLAKQTDEMLGLTKLTDELRLKPGENKIDLGDYHNDSSDEEQLKEEFKAHKTDFYRFKLEYENVDSDTLKEQAECFVRAIQWNLFYYYTGCPSWSWFYPHHYAPYVSDIKDFSGIDLNFGPSKPFLPFQQLLSVLPAGSKKHVPEAFHDLMTSPDSPIIRFYPSEFETDLNGKKQDWEAVVLIPFIEEESLLSAMEPHYKYLTEEENMRNSIKSMEVYQYEPDNLGSVEAPAYFRVIQESHAKVTSLTAADIALSRDEVIRGLLPGAISGTHLGFPHLSGIEFTANLRTYKVKVFEHPSRLENMILKVPYKEHDSDEVMTIAQDLLGEIVFVGWPHLQRGKVVAVLTQTDEYRLISGKVNKREVKTHEFGIDSVEQYNRHRSTLGIELQKVDIIVYVKTIVDRRYVFIGNKAKWSYMWSKSAVPFPYQVILKKVSVINDEVNIDKEVELEEIFGKGQEVFVISPEDYGSFGKVHNISSEVIEIEIPVRSSLDLSGILDLHMNTTLKYYSGHIASQRLSLGTNLFSRITGSIFVQNIENEEKICVGLSLKFTKQGEEVVEYTKKNGNVWLYSEKAIALCDDYMKQFPELFDYLARNPYGKDVYFNNDVFPENAREKLNAIKVWLKSQPHAAAERRPCGSQLLTNEAIKEIEKRVEGVKDEILTHKIIKVQPLQVFVPSSRIGKAPPDSSVQVRLLDRVIAVRRNHSIPLGLCGTVVGYDSPVPTENSLFDILFDKPVKGGETGNVCAEARLCRVTYQTFIDISHGNRRAEPEQPDVSPNTKMENYFPNNREDWRQMCTKNSPRRNLATSNFPRSDKNINMHNIGNTKVKQFFNGYLINSGKTTSAAGPMPTVVVNNSNADTEFRAMWNVLQSHNLPPEDKSLRPQIPQTHEEQKMPVENSVVEQTNALRKILKLNDTPSSQGVQPVDLRPQVPQSNNKPIAEIRPANIFSLPVNQGDLPGQAAANTKVCGHDSCYSHLVRLCTSKNIEYPLYNYSTNPITGEVTCSVVFFSILGTVTGDPCLEKKEAAENAACKAIRHIMQREMLRSIAPPSMGFRPPQYNPPTMRFPAHNIRLGGGGMGQLPTPPMQWCPSRPRHTMAMPEQQQQLNTYNQRHTPRGPNVGNMVRQKPFPANIGTEGSSSEERIPNSPFKEENDVSEGKRFGTHTQPQEKFTSKQNQQAPNTRPPFRKTSRPRLAANFSKPIIKD